MGRALLGEGDREGLCLVVQVDLWAVRLGVDQREEVEHEGRLEDLLVDLLVGLCLGACQVVL